MIQKKSDNGLNRSGQSFSKRWKIGLGMEAGNTPLAGDTLRWRHGAARLEKKDGEWVWVWKRENI
jgi:hypothetical protein